MFAAEIEVLRYRTNNRALVHLVVGTHACAVEYAYEGIDDAVVAYLHVAFDVDERIYFAVLSYLCIGRYFCPCAYFACHIDTVFRVVGIYVVVAGLISCRRPRHSKG